METKDLVIESTVAFKSNRGNFNHQPVFTLTNNPGLTGDDFISLYRIRRSTLPSQSLTGAAISADGRIGLTIGSSQGITSLTGSTRIKAQSLTSGEATLTADWAPGPGSGTLLSTTSTTWRPIYNIIVNQTDTSKMEIITLEEEERIFTSDLSITGLPALSDMNVMGNGVRPLGRQSSGDTAPNGEKGKAEILTYFYNRMEIQDTWTSSGLTGVYDRSYNGLSGALMGKAAGHGAIQTDGDPAAGTATVTGWSLGPIEGGFRLDNGGYIKTNRLAPNASLFNARNETTSGMTFMTYARFHATGSTQNIITIAGDEANPAFALSFKGNGEQADTGIIEFSNHLSSVTAGAITASDNPMAGPYPIKFNRWYHIAGRVSAADDDLSGLSVYINGERTKLARSVASVSGTGPAASTGNIVAMASPTNPLAFFGSDKAGNGAVVAHDLSLTRIFTRGLSDSEVFQNYIATVPGNITLKSFKIG